MLVKLPMICSGIMTPMCILDERKMLKSGLWLDQPDALERIDEKQGQGEFSEEEAARLRSFVERGYLTLRLEEDDALFEQAAREVDRLWKERPVDLAYAYTGEMTSMADAVEKRDRRPLHRILDAHSHCDSLRRLYLHPEIFAWADRILGQPSVAFQSLYYEYGSRLPLHRDPAYIPTDPPSHLLGAWIALEDIRPESGPLAFIPGSHRLPYFEFEPGRIAIRPEEESYFAAYRFNMQECARLGLSEQLYTPRRGEVLIWHASLIHGGSRPADSRRTRRSLVVHFSSRAHYRQRGSSYWKTVRGRLMRREPRFFWAKTTRLLEQDGCAGFDNPLQGLQPRGLTLSEKLRSRLGRI